MRRYAWATAHVWPAARDPCAWSPAYRAEGSRHLSRCRRVAHGHGAVSPPSSQDAAAVHHAPSQIYTADDLWLALQTELAALLCAYLDIGDESHSVVLASVAKSKAPPQTAIMTSSTGSGAKCASSIAPALTFSASFSYAPRPPPLHLVARSVSSGLPKR